MKLLRKTALVLNITVALLVIGTLSWVLAIWYDINPHVNDLTSYYREVLEVR